MKRTMQLLQINFQFCYQLRFLRNHKLTIYANLTRGSLHCPVSIYVRIIVILYVYIYMCVCVQTYTYIYIHARARLLYPCKIKLLLTRKTMHLRQTGPVPATILISQYMISSFPKITTIYIFNQRPKRKSLESNVEEGCPFSGCAENV